MKQVSRKEELTGLAIELMQSSGYGALGLRRLAEEACMQAASLYNHFTSKNDLARQAMALYTLRQGEAIAVLEACATGGERIGLYLDMVETQFAGQQRLCLGLMLTVERHALSSEVVDEVVRFVAANTAWLGAAWDLGRADGSIRSPLSGDAAAPVLFSAMEGMLTFCQLQPESARVFRQQADALLEGLGVLARAA
ncbi:TetR/AcrR family transcriptional regulator [Janthinobacterium sp.]|uniref:TetR/AcrR family transcriptional regulator n=1 Tax=Janthinobacterium sp. TaxID=1871054 RepID=UPI00293D613A|nr:TetR/AcrR family transcriptional regulator [Janthinobacterium sp.]